MGPIRHMAHQTRYVLQAVCATEGIKYVNISKPFETSITSGDILSSDCSLLDIISASLTLITATEMLLSSSPLFW